MAITVHKLERVETEIGRLQRAIDEIRAARLEGRERLLSRKAKEPEFKIFVDEDGLPYLCDFPAQTGAVRRASMDLTRALARLRSSKD